MIRYMVSALIDQSTRPMWTTACRGHITRTDRVYAFLSAVQA